MKPTTLTNRLKQVLATVLTIAALTVGQTAQATSHTVTYTMQLGEYEYYQGAQLRTLIFTRSGAGFSSATEHKAYVQETGFEVTLDDGLWPDLTDSDNPVYPGIGAFHAYFDLGGNEARAFHLDFVEDTQGIRSLTPTPSQKVEGSGYYTLGGRKLDKVPNYKGLYIHNGRKVVVK